ncbi:MAG: PA0069 family radical SAM protein [Phycisphaerales bacterium]|nr:PA0069 family radical SAM protein [Phycisphaerales bacterium]
MKRGYNKQVRTKPFEYVDSTARGVAARGRGAATLNPGNRFEDVRLHVLGEHLDNQRAEHPDGVQVATQALHDHSKTIINHVVNSPDIGFEWSINPYRGCEHGCIYCYARPTHEELGMSSGLDFETKIMVKHDAPKLLRKELAHPKWKGDTIVFCGVTDCYQPLEAKLKLTRSLLEICAECRQPVGIITKNHLVTRDVDLLSELAKLGAASAAVSITTLDPKLAAKMEPRASSPTDRLKAVRELTRAGIPTTVMVAPVIPGLTDTEMPAILEAAAEHGARSAGWVLLRLPHQIKALFLDWLQRNYPQKAARVEHLIREMRDGALYQSKFKIRQRGTGKQAEIIAKMFRMYAKRFGLDKPGRALSSAHFRRPMLNGQLGLFADQFGA